MENEQGVISQYLLARFTDHFLFTLSKEEREQWKTKILEDLRHSADTFQIYQVFPALADVDVLFWATSRITDRQDTPKKFFTGLARTFNSLRPILEVKRVLWGYTRPSIYARGKSSQEIDPFSETRKKYLVVYPFSKTAEWYLLSRETRQGMMNEHIRIGRQHPEILQLLLYSFGLQDQEFVVSYETDNLFEFSELVNELRSTQARIYTLLDTPIITAIYHPPEETLNLFG